MVCRPFALRKPCTNRPDPLRGGRGKEWTIVAMLLKVHIGPYSAARSLFPTRPGGIRRMGNLPIALLGNLPIIHPKKMGILPILRAFCE